MDADVLHGNVVDQQMLADPADEQPVLADLVGDLKPITASNVPTQTEGLRVERFGRAGPDGFGRYWQWRWWEVENGKKSRRGRYGGIVNEGATEYWKHRTAAASTG